MLATTRTFSMQDSQMVPEERPGTSPTQLPCAGLTSLDPGDVLCLLRLPFWLVAANYNFLFAARQVAILCFMAIAHIGVKPLARLMLRPRDAINQVYESEWWFDENGDGHFCIKDRKIRNHKAPDALTFAVRRYLNGRLNVQSDHLFVTRSGHPLDDSSYSLTLLTLAQQLKLGAPVATMMKAFFAEHAAAVLDEECLAFLTGRRYRGRAPKIGLGLQRDLLLLLDPFQGRLRDALENDDFARQLLSTEFPTRLPITGRPPDAYLHTDWKPPLNANDHPWIAELMVPRRPEKQFRMREQREEIFLTYYPRMKPLLESGELPQYQAAELLGYSRSAWRIRVLRATFGDDWWMETNPVYPGKPRNRRI
jgi:hypothetical protein